MITNKPYSKYEMQLAADAYAQTHPRIAATFLAYVELINKLEMIIHGNNEIKATIEPVQGNSLECRCPRCGYNNTEFLDVLPLENRHGKSSS